MTLYVVCRALEVETVVETGALFGSFDAHVLAAMERNGGGTLYSLDLPGGPPGSFEYGHLIPDRCRDRWTLHRGDAREVLPELLEAVGPVDCFLHDSDHRLPHMRLEYETALPHLAPGGILASHDVRLSRLFDRFTAANGLPSCVVCDTGIARVPSSERPSRETATARGLSLAALGWSAGTDTCRIRASVSERAIDHFDCFSQ